MLGCMCRVQWLDYLPKLVMFTGCQRWWTDITRFDFAGQMTDEKYCAVLLWEERVNGAALF